MPKTRPTPGALPTGILTIGYDYINHKAEATEAKANAENALLTADLARVAALGAQSAAEAAAAAASAAQTASEGAGVDLVNLVSMVTNLSNVLGGYPGPLSWSDLLADNPVAGHSALYDIYQRVQYAAGEAGDARAAAVYVLDTIRQYVNLLSRYSSDTAGVEAFTADSLAGRLTGNGPLVVYTPEGEYDPYPVMNPLFYMFKGANGEWYPIMEGLLADVLNLLNLYPRP